MMPLWAAHAAAAAAGRPDELARCGRPVRGDRGDAVGGGGGQRGGPGVPEQGRPTGRRRARCASRRAPGRHVRAPERRRYRAPVLVVPLTARERDIAALAAQGVTSQQIADQLYLSVRTVNNHLQNVYAKLGVSGRRQLADVLGERPGTGDRPTSALTSSFSGERLGVGAIGTHYSPGLRRRRGHGEPERRHDQPHVT